MTSEPLFGADDLIRTLSQSLRNREHALKSAPGLLRRTLETGAWRDFRTPEHAHVTHERFAEFVTAEPFDGLGITVEYVRRVVADDVVTLDLLDQALQGRQGARTDLVSNIHEERPAGTTRDRALRKLRIDAPELHAEVLANRLSAHAAMVQAGFRPQTFTVRADRPESVAAALRKHLDPASLTELRRLLDENGASD